MRFSERIGKTPVKKLAQVDSIDNELKISLWNVIVVYYIDSAVDSHYHGYTKAHDRYNFFVKCWQNNLIKPIDEIPLYFGEAVQYLKEYFLNTEWRKTLQLIEEIIDYDSSIDKDKYIEECNFYLNRENSAYRFVGNKLAQITSQVEINEVAGALDTTRDKYVGVHIHLNTALDRMSDKKKPDYRNSIKESISAIESLAKILSGKEKATLSEALNALEKKGIKLHGALKSSFQALYGYTSDAEGIRHALLDEDILSKDDAKYMLVSCSAFVNYLIALNNES